MAYPIGNATAHLNDHPALHNDRVDAKAHFLVTDDGTDQTTKMQQAVDAATGECWVGPGTFIVDGLRARSNVTLRLAPGATLKLKSSATASAALIRPATGDLENFTLEGGTVDGNAAGQVANKDAIALDVTTGSIDRLKLNVKVLNAYRHGIFIAENTPSDGSKEVVGCEVDGHGIGTVGYGIYADYAPGAVITRNVVRNAGNVSDAIELGNGGKYICTHNVLEDSQLQFPFAHDSVIAFNLLLGTRANIQNDSNTADRVRVIGNTIVNNTPDTSSFAGITVNGADAVVMGNSVKVATHRGIRTYGVRPIVMGNRIETTSATAASQGVICEIGQYARIIGNTIRGKWLHGIYVEHHYNHVSGNYVEADGTTGTCISLGASGDIGLTLTHVLVQGNQLAVGNTKFNPNNQADPTNRIQDNAGYNNAATPSVASAATITLTYAADFFDITGTTTITSVTASWPGRVVTLKFAGVLTFTDGSNLKLNGNFVTTADDTITVVCDGTNWFEVARSAN